MAKKVLLINRFYHPLGKAGPSFVTRILAELLAEGGDQAVVLSENCDNSILEEILNGVHVYRIPPPTNDRKTEVLLKKILELENPDVVHTLWTGNFPFSMLNKLLGNKGLRWVHNVQEYGLLCQQGILFKDGKNCEKICPECQQIIESSREHTVNVDAVVGVSEFTLNKHLKEGLFVNTKQKIIIYNCQKIQQQLDFTDSSSENLRLGFLGRVVPEKGVEVLIREMLLLNNQKSLSLLIAGECSLFYKQQLKWKFPKAVFTLTGFLKQEIFFSQIDICIIPSIIHDSLPRIVAESYAYGVPVIASNRGGIPEVVVEGKTGFLFDPDLPGDLGQKIELFRNNPDLLQQMEKNAFAESEKYTPEKIMSQYRKVYFPNED